MIFPTTPFSIVLLLWITLYNKAFRITLIFKHIHRDEAKFMSTASRAVLSYKDVDVWQIYGNISYLQEYLNRDGPEGQLNSLDL